MHHKHDKSDHDTKHFARMITNIEKALQTNENLDKFVIQEKISQNIEVKDHVKTHNRIIDKFKKIKHNIKRQAEHALLEFIKYGFDRTPQNVWKNIMESKLKQLHPHHLEKDIRECVIAIKMENQLSSTIRNAFKNVKDNEIIASILKSNDKIACIQKFIEGLTSYPLKNDKLQGMDNVINGAFKANLLSIRSILQTISQQFQKLKPYAHNPNLAITFSAALSPKLIHPIDNLIKKWKSAETQDAEQANRWKDLKSITQNLANNQLERSNENYQRLNQALVGDLKKIKVQMSASCKSSFELYKKMTEATNQFIKKGSEVKKQKIKERSSVLLPDALKQIDPFLTFCNQISSLQIIKERSKQPKYASLQSNHFILQLYYQILRDCEFDRPNDCQAQLKKLLDFNTSLYNLAILKKKGGSAALSFDKLYSESGRMLAQIQRLMELENIQPNKGDLESKDNEIKKLKRSKQEAEQLYKNQVKQCEADTMFFKTKLEAEINVSIEHTKTIGQLRQELQNKELQHQNLLEQFQTQKQIIKQRQDTINRLQNKQEEFSNEQQAYDNDKQSEDVRSQQHKTLLTFTEQLYDEIMHRFEMVPYFDKYFNQQRPVNVEENVKQLTQKMQFLFKLFQCYILFAKKSKIWETNAVMLEMTAANFEEFEKKCLEMWRSDLEQCLKTFTSRGAYMHEYQDSVISEL